LKQCFCRSGSGPVGGRLGHCTGSAHAHACLVQEPVLSPAAVLRLLYSTQYENASSVRHCSKVAMCTPIQATNFRPHERRHKTAAQINLYCYCCCAVTQDRCTFVSANAELASSGSPASILRLAAPQHSSQQVLPASPRTLPPEQMPCIFPQNKSVQPPPTFDDRHTVDLTKAHGPT